MNKQIEQDLATMSNECHKIMAMSMKEIEQISYDPFAISERLLYLHDR
jgi:hypothetical protein